MFDRRHRALSVGIVASVSLVAFEQLALATVAPTIARDLDAVGLYGWIFSAFLLAQIVGAVGAGVQADRRGPAPVFLVALVLVGAGLSLGALSATMPFLILGRVLQGLGGGALTACSYAIINKAYPDELRSRMLALFSSAYILPALVGPAAAGLLAEHLGWRSVFYVFLPFLVPVGLLVVPATGRMRGTQPTDRREEVRGEQSRVPKAFALAAGTGLLLAGLETAAGEALPLPFSGASPVLVGLLMVAGGASLAAPALRGLLPAGTFAARSGLPASVANKGLLVATFAYTEAYLVLALASLPGYQVAGGGLAISAGALSWIAAAWGQERLDRRDGGRGRRGRALAGTVLLAAGPTALAALVFTASLTLPLAVAGWVVSGAGMGMANPAGTAIAFARAPEGNEGVVSSSVLLAELFTPAIFIGVGGALVAASQDSQLGVERAFGLSIALAALCLASAYRLPQHGVREEAPDVNEC